MEVSARGRTSPAPASVAGALLTHLIALTTEFVRHRRRIGIVLPDLRGGGTERVRLLLAKEFLARGFAVEFALMRVQGELLAEVPAECRIVDLKASRARHLWRSLHRYMSDDCPDAILAGLWPLTGFSCLAKVTSRTQATLVVSEHNDFRRVPAIGRVERSVLKSLGGLIYQPADAIVTVSHGVADSLRACTSIPPDKIQVVHNAVRPPPGIEPIAHEDAKLLAWWGAARYKVIAVGSLKRQKGFDFLLSSFAKVVQQLDARLLVLGEGALRGELESLAAKLGISDSAVFAGFRPDPYPYLQMADLFVLSSRWEGLPGVLIEALTCGTPVVSTDCQSGPPEVLENGAYGRLVAVDDCEGLAEAIWDALMQPHDREALKRRGAKFSPSAATQKYLSLLFPDRRGNHC